MDFIPQLEVVDSQTELKGDDDNKNDPNQASQETGICPSRGSSRRSGQGLRLCGRGHDTPPNVILEGE